MIERYRSAIAEIPGGTVAKGDILNDSLLVAREGNLAVYYAPFDHVNTDASLALVGLTPGWQETQIAYQVFRDTRSSGGTEDEGLIAVKAAASFSGMRTRLCRWLDELGVARWLGLPSTTALFVGHAHLLHATSLSRYPVFVGPSLANYTGHGPAPGASPLLMSMVHDVLLPELAMLPTALIVPMGRSVSAALAAAEIDAARCLYGFPHPSGANGHGTTQFSAERAMMQAVVGALPLR